MRTGAADGGGQHAGITSKRSAVFCIALLAMLAAGCAAHSSVGGLPAGRGVDRGHCPADQMKVCHVGWPSRLGGNERGRVCRCS